MLKLLIANVLSLDKETDQSDLTLRWCISSSLGSPEDLSGGAAQLCWAEGCMNYLYFSRKE